MCVWDSTVQSQRHLALPGRPAPPSSPRLLSPPLSATSHVPLGSTSGRRNTHSARPRSCRLHRQCPRSGSAPAPGPPGYRTAARPPLAPLVIERLRCTGTALARGGEAGTRGHPHRPHFGPQVASLETQLPPAAAHGPQCSAPALHLFRWSQAWLIERRTLAVRRSAGGACARGDLRRARRGSWVSRGGRCRPRTLHLAPPAPSRVPRALPDPRISSHGFSARQGRLPAETGQENLLPTQPGAAEAQVG